MIEHFNEKIAVCIEVHYDVSLKKVRLEFERDYIAVVMEHCRWNVSKAATILGMKRNNIYRKMRQLGIEPVRTHKGAAVHV